MAGDRVGTILHINAAVAGEVPGLRELNGARVHGGAPPDPAWTGAGPSVGVLPSVVIVPTNVPGLLSKEGGISGMPSRWGEGGG